MSHITNMKVREQDFSFANYNAHEMLGIVNYAKDVYYNHKREWNKIVDKGNEDRLLMEQFS